MRFFFYGTLLDGSDNPVAREVHRLVSPAGEATVKGHMFAVRDRSGWFPALIAGDGIAHGHIYETNLGFTPADLARLDAYEDFDPTDLEESLYRRCETPVSSAGRNGAAAQVYWFNQPLPSGSEPIAHGDFRKWLAESGRTAFTGLREA